MKDIGMSRVLLYVIVIAAGLFLAFVTPLALKDKTPPSPAEDVARRIAPVARFELQGASITDTVAGEDAAATPAAENPATPESQESPATSATPTTPESPATPATKDGAAAYASICFTCHDYGVAGAPKKGDKAAWASRLAAGEAALYASALNGKGLMQAKGGKSTLSDEEVKAAVDYLIAFVR
jgi:cytochrome c5